MTTHEDRLEFASDLMLMKDRAFRLGLLKTAQALEPATQAVGYEIAEYMGTCRFVHTRRSGGREGMPCGRTEDQHCMDESGTHPGCGKVHHTFHRKSNRKAKG